MDIQLNTVCAYCESLWSITKEIMRVNSLPWCLEKWKTSQGEPAPG